MSADPRSGAQRRRDTEHRLTHDKDVYLAGTAPTKENQTYCSKLVRSSQATPTETAKAAPPNKMETR